jgi:hypothetical protein
MKGLESVFKDKNNVILELKKLIDGLKENDK